MPPQQEAPELVEPQSLVEPQELVEPWVQPALSDAEREVLLRHAREDFVVPRPSQLHPGTVVSPGMRVHVPAPRAVPNRRQAEPVESRRPGRTRSRIRTGLISLVLILAGVAIAAAIPLVLSLLGS